jgi:hypothetical protein
MFTAQGLDTFSDDPNCFFGNCIDDFTEPDWQAIYSPCSFIFNRVSESLFFCQVSHQETASMKIIVPSGPLLFLVLRLLFTVAFIVRPEKNTEPCSEL